jgi:multiple antibiotic resistance protein
MLTLTARVVKRSLLSDVLGHIGILLAVMALSVTVYLSYRYSEKITERISPQTAHGMLRIVAFVLLCIGVQITSNGAETLLKTVLKP